MAIIALILGAYLVGSLPQVYLLGRLKGVDLTQQSDLHESLWDLSHKLGLIGFLIDLAKGPIVVFAGRSLGFPTEAVALAGLVAVLGQIWPIYLLRSGGMGNSIGLTMAASLAPYPLLIVLIAPAVGLGWRIITHILKGQPALGPPHSHSLPLSVFFATILLPVASWLLDEPAAVTLAFVGLFVAIMIRRLTKDIDSYLGTAPHKGRALLSRLLFD